MSTPPTVYAPTTGTTTHEEVEEYVRRCIINQQKVHGTEGD
jgi:hypothetical protein